MGSKWRFALSIPGKIVKFDNWLNYVYQGTPYNLDDL